MAICDGGWRRARSDEQRAERREAILAAAGALLDEGGVDAAGLNAIGRAAGVSKSTTYLYFDSREAVLLELMRRSFTDWAEAVRAGFAAIDGGDPRAACSAAAAVMAAEMAARPRLGKLIHAAAGVLEQNVAVETVVDFKLAMIGVLGEVVAALVAAVPAMPEEAAAGAICKSALAVGGAWPACHPSPVVAAALERPELAAMAMPFEPTIREVAEALLRDALPR
ncbi:MAG: TetR family transcriptional regulator [Planctomycetota bacterium]